MKKLVLLILCMLLCLPSAYGEGRIFPDVPAESWYSGYVTELAAREIVKGYTDGTFGPQREVRYDEALKLILLAAEYEEQVPLPGGNWISGYRALAVQAGFLPQDADLAQPITRGEVGRLAARALGLFSEGESPYPDVDDGAFTALYEAEIITGILQEGALHFVPEKTLTRAEISAIVWRMNRFAEQKREEENHAIPVWLAVPAEEDEPLETDFPLEMGAGESDIPPSEENPDAEKPNGPSPEDPAPAGTIRYRDRLLKILEGVPVFDYDPASFSLKNGRMTCSDPRVELIHGIDVSSHQGIIDWGRVKASGVEFAMLRAGYRGYTAGSLHADGNFAMNIRHALDAGVQVGAYVFSQAINEQEAIEEADLVIRALQGYEVTYPVVFDWEVIGSQNARTNGLSTQKLMACAKAFCHRVRQAGYTPMVYFNADWGYLKFDLSQISEIDFWLAQYKEQPEFYYDFAMWQYSDKGTVDGIAGNVDLDVLLRRKG